MAAKEEIIASAYDPIDGREAQILGKVKAVIREY